MAFFTANSWSAASLPLIVICAFLPFCLVEIKESKLPSSDDAAVEELCQPKTVMNQGCNVCTCEDDGTWACGERSCDFLPCENKVCGEACSECPPWKQSPPCQESPALKACSDQGQCLFAPVECTVPPSDSNDNSEGSDGDSTDNGESTTAGESGDSDEDSDDTMTTQDPDVTWPVLTHCEETSNFGDPTRIGALEINNDLLSTDVMYSGGCIDDQFRLCWNGSFLESIPEQAVLILGHEDFDDACDDWVEDKIRFDLTPLRRAWLAVNEGQVHGAIQIHVRSQFDNQEQAKILYQF